MVESLDDSAIEKLEGQMQMLVDKLNEINEAMQTGSKKKTKKLEGKRLKLFEEFEQA